MAEYPWRRIPPAAPTAAACPAVGLFSLPRARHGRGRMDEPNNGGRGRYNVFMFLNYHIVM